MRDHVELKIIFVVSEFLTKRPWKEQVFVPRGPGISKANDLKLGNQKKTEKDNHIKYEETFDGKRADVLFSGTNAHALFDKEALFEWIRNETLSVSDKKLEPQLTSVPASLQAGRTPKDDLAAVFLIVE